MMEPEQLIQQTLDLKQTFSSRLTDLIVIVVASMRDNKQPRIVV